MVRRLHWATASAVATMTARTRPTRSTLHQYCAIVPRSTKKLAMLQKVTDCWSDKAMVLRRLIS